MKLGKSDLNVSRIALGCMRMSDDRETTLRTIHAALDAGIDFFDHADIYGGGKREATFSAIWEEHPHLRGKIYLQSKCGIRFADHPNPGDPARFDFSYEHITNAVEGSLRRLKTDYLDALLLHRPDVLVEPEEVARAFGDLHRTGKVRYFGVSNHTPMQMELLQRYLDLPLVANQVQLSITHASLFYDGVIANMMDDAPASREQGMVEYCRLNNITLQSWGPLAGGWITGRDTNTADPHIQKTAALVQRLAEKYSVGPAAIPVAWLLRHPAGIQPVIGTTNPARIKACCEADSITMSREDWYALFEAGRGARVP